MENEFDKPLLLTKTEKGSNPIIRFEGDDNSFSSTNFLEKHDFFENLLSTSLSSENPFLTEAPATGVDSVILRGWKNIENVPARLIEKYDEIVVLECLIDKETRHYEEREFRLKLFDGYDLSIGALFYLRVFERPNEIRMEIHDDPRLVFESDFPKGDFARLFKESKLFKK